MMTMQSKAIKKYGTAVILLSFLLLGMDGKPRESDERRQLEERRAQLATQIETLKQEQDFLLFQKSFAGSDSKYLILDLRAGKGVLKYRNRALRNFEFPRAKKNIPAAMKKAIVTLSGKIDGTPRKRQLVFAEPILIIQSKHMKVNVRKGISLIRIPLETMDLGALFFAMEPGSMAYVMN
jgi:hypothetical protein